MKHSESTYDIPEEISLKYYAVKNGRKPGIYKTWDECKAMVDKFPGAVYKSFKTLGEAKEYFGDTDSSKGELSEKNDAGAYAFVDGSFNKATATYGYGGYLFTGTEKIILQGNGCDPEMAAMRNVAGEILGSRAAIEKALELGIEKLSVYYDYMGIEMWATGGWKRNKAGTIGYYDFIQSVKDRIDIRFVKVKGHSGVEGNEEADRLAKQAVGIE